MFSDAVLSMGKEFIEKFVHETSEEELITVLALCNEKARLSILQKVPKAYYKRLTENLALQGIKRGDLQEFFMSLDDLIITDDKLKEKLLERLREYALKSSLLIKPLCNLCSRNIYEFVELIKEIFAKANLSGLKSLELDTGKIADRLLTQGLKAVLEVDNSLAFEKILQTITERHLQEEKLKCKIVTTALLDLFGSEQGETLFYEIAQMIPFNNK